MSNNPFQGGDFNPEEFLKKMNEKEDAFRQLASNSMSSSYDDIADVMFIFQGIINDSPNLNAGAMIQITEVFRSVMGAFAESNDASMMNCPFKSMLAECGIVMADGKNSEDRAEGSIEMADLGIMAAIAAVRVFLFMRLRKVSDTIPMAKEAMKENPQRGAMAVMENMRSAVSIMKTMEKMGLGLIADHPVSVDLEKGIKDSKALLQQYRSKQ